MRISSGAIGVILGIIGVALAIFFYLYPNSNPRLSYSIESDVLLSSEFSDVINPEYLNVPEAGVVHSVTLTVWNSGNRDLDSEDLKLASLSFIGAHDVFVSNISSNFASTPSIRRTQNTVTPLFIALKMDHKIEYTVLVSSITELVPEIEINAAGFSVIKRDLQDVQRAYSTILLIPAVMGFIAFMILTEEMGKRISASKNSRSYKLIENIRTKLSPLFIIVPLIILGAIILVRDIVLLFGPTPP